MWIKNSSGNQRCHVEYMERISNLSEEKLVYICPPEVTDEEETTNIGIAGEDEHGNLAVGDPLGKRVFHVKKGLSSGRN